MHLSGSGDSEISESLILFYLCGPISDRSDFNDGMWEGGHWRKL